MTVYDVLILLFIAFLVCWALWDYRRRKNEKRFVMTLLMLAPVLISLASLLFGLWGCHKIKKTIHDIFGPIETKAATVVGVESGNVVKLKAGIRERSRRTKNCTLWGISIPREVEVQAKTNLQKLLSGGDEIRVEIHEGADGWLDDKFGDISGVPISKNGDNCCLEQLREGLAKATVDDKQFKAAQKEAQKARKGIWAKTKSEEGEENI
jgi:hypothetical protein